MAGKRDKIKIQKQQTPNTLQHVRLFVDTKTLREEGNLEAPKRRLSMSDLSPRQLTTRNRQFQQHSCTKQDSYYTVVEYVQYEYSIRKQKRALGSRDTETHSDSQMQEETTSIKRKHSPRMPTRPIKTFTKQIEITTLYSDSPTPQDTTLRTTSL